MHAAAHVRRSMQRAHVEPCRHARFRMHAWLDKFDPFIVLSATAILLGGAAELGVRLGSRDGKEGRKLLVSSLLSAAALLLSLFLGFSFSMAEARFANRRGLVLEEANAIGTT